MLNVTGHTTTLDDAFLNQMRRIGDPPADEVAHDLRAYGHQALLSRLIRTDELWDEGGRPSALLSDEVRAFLAARMDA